MSLRIKPTVFGRYIQYTFIKMWCADIIRWDIMPIHNALTSSMDGVTKYAL